MKTHKNVLVLPGGTAIGLEIQSALRFRKEIRLHSASQEISNHAPFVFARHHVIPSVHHDGWLEGLNEVIAANAIDFVFPAHDDVVVELARHADAISARVIGSPLETCEVASSKSLTYERLRGIVPVPVIHYEPELIKRYPVFAKPDRSQGSRGALRIDSEVQLRAALEQDAMVVTEYLPGEEFTVDCFTDREAGLLFCGARRRVRIRNGIAMNTVTVHDRRFSDYANAISAHLRFFGAWFFQVKYDANGELKLLEVAPRIAGTSAAHRVQGVNLPMLSLYESERLPTSILINAIDVELDRALVNRYRSSVSYSSVYVDLDDTLIVGDAVNVELIQFLYQCVNEKKRIVLLTKHPHDVQETLDSHRLTLLFDEVIHITRDAEKADQIDGPSPILIDDSFSERRGVAERLGIPTFDTSMLEMLLDHRR